VAKTILMFSPGFPGEMPFFTRGLRKVGATVIGLGDQPQSALPDVAKESLSAYVQVGSFTDEAAVFRDVEEIHRRARLDRIECLWEPYMVLAAKLREHLGIPGMSVAKTIPFRDKEIMKQRLDAAGIRTPRHHSVTTVDGCREAARDIGFPRVPIVVKPIAGAGSADTYRVGTVEELELILPALRHVPEVSVEEFIEGVDYTYETICVDGKIQHDSISFYRPRALEARSHEWISPQTVVVRDVDAPHLRAGREMGAAVLKALDFDTGYTHMEWFLTPSGEAVFGEIAARPPGAHLVDLINFASDVDTFTGWAEAVCHGRFTQPIERKYNAAWIYKRAQGQGRIHRIEGLTQLMAELSEHVVVLDLLPVGAPRRNWKQTLVSDGMIIVRHPDLQKTLEIADRFGTELRIFAG
jgi:formate-dependent phosphoribosylglycinamide formyltransferase (GAR transformylase)